MLQIQRRYATREHALQAWVTGVITRRIWVQWNHIYYFHESESTFLFSECLWFRCLWKCGPRQRPCCSMSKHHLETPLKNLLAPLDSIVRVSKVEPCGTPQVKSENLPVHLQRNRRFVRGLWRQTGMEGQMPPRLPVAPVDTANHSEVTYCSAADESWL